jgi:acyl dehydratase
VSSGDVALYTALFGSRFALGSSDPFARALGLPSAPLDSMLVFHLVFGRTVADVSLNAVANLGYAGGRFGAPVYPGDTVTSDSRVIGLRQNKDGHTGVVYVHSTGVNQHGAHGAGLSPLGDGEKTRCFGPGARSGAARVARRGAGGRTDLPLHSGPRAL